MRVSISPLAERDLEAIGDYIADDNPARAVSFVAELRDQCATIAKAPQVYQLRPELGNAINIEQGYKPLTIYSPREVISHATEN